LGKVIHNHPLHVRMLADMELEYRAGFSLFVDAGRLLSLEENETATSEQQQLLRLLPPLETVHGRAVHESGLESFGGQGYIMEDRHI
jgi:alkylation response protein AidB-like acyl-CoA dehydrogenase